MLYTLVSYFRAPSHFVKLDHESVAQDSLLEPKYLEPIFELITNEPKVTAMRESLRTLISRPPTFADEQAQAMAKRKKPATKAKAPAKEATSSAVTSAKFAASEEKKREAKKQNREAKRKADAALIMKGRLKQIKDQQKESSESVKKGKTENVNDKRRQEEAEEADHKRRQLLLDADAGEKLARMNMKRKREAATSDHKEALEGLKRRAMRAQQKEKVLIETLGVQKKERTTLLLQKEVEDGERDLLMLGGTEIEDGGVPEDDEYLEM